MEWRQLTLARHIASGAMSSHPETPIPEATEGAGRAGSAIGRGLNANCIFGAPRIHHQDLPRKAVKFGSLPSRRYLTGCLSESGRESRAAMSISGPEVLRFD